jgi:hypothetical protein
MLYMADDQKRARDVMEGSLLEQIRLEHSTVHSQAQQIKEQWDRELKARQAYQETYKELLGQERNAREMTEATLGTRFENFERNIYGELQRLWGEVGKEPPAPIIVREVAAPTIVREPLPQYVAPPVYLPPQIEYVKPTEVISPIVEYVKPTEVLSPMVEYVGPPEVITNTISSPIMSPGTSLSIAPLRPTATYISGAGPYSGGGSVSSNVQMAPLLGTTTFSSPMYTTSPMSTSIEAALPMPTGTTQLITSPIMARRTGGSSASFATLPTTYAA